MDLVVGEKGGGIKIIRTFLCLNYSRMQDAKFKMNDIFEILMSEMPLATNLNTDIIYFGCLVFLSSFKLVPVGSCNMEMHSSLIRVIISIVHITFDY